MDALQSAVGRVGEARWIVQLQHTADQLGNPGVLVLATPMVLDLMVMAAANALQPVLPSDWISVGIAADFEHFKPTPVGVAVTARASVVSVKGVEVEFAISVHDPLEEVARGRHRRFCLPRDTFTQRVAQKTDILQQLSAQADTSS
jgi:predicted thioesterase